MKNTDNLADCPCGCKTPCKVVKHKCGCVDMSDCKGDDSYVVSECKEHSFECEDAFNVVEVDIDSIKQNGIDPKSRLFWALMPEWVNYVALINPSRQWIGYDEAPKIGVCNSSKVLTWVYPEVLAWCPVGIKMAYTGDWKDSLHYRGDYE